MSLINDALRRASQNEKNRQQPQAPTPAGMEAVPKAQGSPVNMILGVAVVVAFLLAGWFFREWWITRKAVLNAQIAVTVVPPAPAAQPPPAPVVAVKPAPVVQAAPVKAAPMPAFVPAPTLPPPPAAAPPAAPVVAETPFAWPADLKISAIFYSLHNPRVLINGGIYGVGEEIEGCTIKEIHKNRITLAASGQTKDLLMAGQ